MGGSRLEALRARLERGNSKTQEILRELTAEQWRQVIYSDPRPWTVRDLAAHFLSAEEALLHIAKDTAAGGEGAPAGFDYDAFNADEQVRLAGLTPEQLPGLLQRARETTLAWIVSLAEEDLDRVGRHPVLGDVSVEAMILAIYAHQLLHMRELQGVLR